jgi:hypothetical protein
MWAALQDIEEMRLMREQAERDLRAMREAREE